MAGVPLIEIHRRAAEEDQGTNPVNKCESSTRDSSEAAALLLALLQPER